MLLNNIGRIALIIPASALCTSRMESLKDAIIKNSSSWISFYGNRPATLFSGAQQNLAIIVSQRMLNCNSSWGTKHMRWSSIERWSLFYSISYIEHDESTIYSRYGDHNYKRILKKISSYKNRITGLKVSDHRVYYSNSAGYWLHASTYLKNPTISRDRVIMLSSTKEKVLVCAILNSSLFYLVYSSISDLYHVTLKELGFITIPDDYSIDRLDKLVRLLEESLYENMSLIEKQEKTGLCQQEEFYPKASKSIIDLIDHDLMYIYGMNTLDLDYIINYDIKYRMGSIVNDGDNDKIQIDGE